MTLIELRSVLNGMPGLVLSDMGEEYYIQFVDYHIVYGVNSGIEFYQEFLTNSDLYSKSRWKLVDQFEHTVPKKVVRSRLINYSNPWTALLDSTNDRPGARSSIVPASAVESTTKCICDFHTVILRTGCICGGE